MIDGLGMDSLELVDIDLDNRGNVLPPKHDKKIIIDADTLAYQVCRQLELSNPILFESEEEIEEIKQMYPFDEEENCYYTINLEEAEEYAIGKINIILDRVGGKPENVELHFTGTRVSFRYKLLREAFPDNPERHYKARRVNRRKPAGLEALKHKLLEKYKGGIHYEYESDDVVVMRKRYLKDKAILVALDKDVWGNIPGKHWNYYENAIYGKEMHWVDISKDVANFNQYLQVLTGDRSDNVPGLPRVGAKTAMKYIEVGMTEKELWDGVIKAYKDKCDYGDPVEMAILNMRLVNMRQLDDNYKISLWEPVFDKRGDHKYIKI
jgi:hypothetical protein